MKCVVFLNGDSPDSLSPSQKEFYRKKVNSCMLICADGGANIALSLGLLPDFIVGDMDSVDPEVLKSIPADCIVRYPVEKDRTDGQLALELALEKGCQEIEFCFAVSRQIDHTLSNIRMLVSVPNGVKAEISEHDLGITVQKSGRKTIVGRPGDRISLIPLSEKVTGLSLDSFKYGLENGTLSAGGLSGISNELIGESAEISIEEGILAIIHYHG